MQPATARAALFGRIATAAWTLSQRHWRLVLVAMLVLLHVAAVRGVADPWARALMLAHLGLLLLWQPFLPQERHVSAAQVAILGVAAGAVMLWLDWWLLAFWVVVLSGLIGGKVYQQHARWQRRAYLLVLFYLLALLAIVILPQIAPRPEISGEVRMLAEYALPVLLLVLVLLPVEPEPAEAAQVIDFFYSVFLMLLLVVVILGSFTFMTLGRVGYLEALTKTVFLVAGTVLLVGIAWNPRIGFSGLRVFFSRYLFSIGLPVERWLHFLAELSQLESRPSRFLSDAVTELGRLPLVAGVDWRAEEADGSVGIRSEHSVAYGNSALSLTIYSRYRAGPALHWHLLLLGQLLGEFYLAKQREQRLREASYLQAVHETGARLTHDIKNLLQSLNVLCSVAMREESGTSPEAQALIRRQLPAFSQRLSETLEKLQRPQPADESFVPARPWWDGLARQYGGQGVEFEAAMRDGARIPEALVGSVADNLLRNALAKRVADPGIRIRVALSLGRRLELKVCDTGRAVPKEIAESLLRSPVPSSGGMGIGLYQAARQAQAAGMALELRANRDGEVCFALTGPAPD